MAPLLQFPGRLYMANGQLGANVIPLALATLLKFSPYWDSNFGFFGVIGFQFQDTPVGLRRTRDGGKMNLEYPPCFNLFYPVGQSCAEVKTARFKFQGFVSLCPDSNGFGDLSIRLSPEIDVSGRYIDGYLDKGLNG